MIENAAKGENWMFRSLYAEVNGKEKDILENGKLSCAIFVSSILYVFKMIKDPHATVDKTIDDMITLGWYEIEKPKPGAILKWEKQEGHYHIGFYVGGNMAISNDSKDTGFPHKHHYTYNDTRKIEKIYWHKELND